MKKLALISTFCDNEEKIQTLKNNLIKFKELDVDTLIITPHDLLPNDIIGLATHCIITNENPIPPITNVSMTAFRYIGSNFNNIRHTLLFPYYAWASLNQIKRLLSYGVDLDYDIYYQLLYDLDLDNNIKSIIDSNITNYFFGNVKKDTVFECGGIFGIFDKRVSKEYSNLIKYQELIKYASAEDYIKSIQNYLQVPIHPYVVKDTIHNTQDQNTQSNPYYFNSKNINMFVDNSRLDCHHTIPKNNNKAIIHFWDFGGKKQVKINGKKYLLLNEELIIIDTNDEGIITLEVDGEVENIDIKGFPIREIKIDGDNSFDYILNKKLELDENK